MSLSRYAIGLGQMPADEEGRCSSAVILYDPNTAKELIRLSYDTVGDILTGISDNPALAQQIAEAEKRGLMQALQIVRHRERSAITTIGKAMAPSAASALFDVAELLANEIDPSWSDEDAEDGPFALLRRNCALPSQEPQS